VPGSGRARQPGDSIQPWTLGNRVEVLVHAGSQHQKLVVLRRAGAF
jgi:hypothetical protein